MPKCVLVGLSGGVDSAVAAYLLKEQGYEVSGGFMINYLTTDDSCPTRIDMQAAREVAEYLDIPFFTFDFIEEYEKRVLHYVFEGYKKGLTPNPDVFCNTWIKFDLFREEALSCGYDFVATGHYSRIQRTKDKGQNEEKEKEKENKGISLFGNQKLVQLLRGVDPDKDQSYFLSALTSEQLKHTLFPIGYLCKSEVRDIARKAGLPNAERRDSQGLCFVGKVNFSEFLKSHIKPKKGNILDIHGNILGEHDGAFQYTIGQRKGIAVGGGPALYVLEKDIQKNTIVVGEEDDPRLFRDSCILSDMNWLVDVELPMKCEAQVRYRQKAVPCLIKEKKGKKKIQNLPPFERGMSNEVRQGDFATKNPQPRSSTSSARDSSFQKEHNANTFFEIAFDSPIRAITPGQVCALYDGERVLGSGIITQNNK